MPGMGMTYRIKRRIAGIGTHRELLYSCTVYREIVASQLAEEELVR